MSGSIDQINMRRSNLAFVLAELIREPRTRAQLAFDIGMTKGAVGSLVGDLVTRGLVELSEPSSSGTVGRPGQIATAVPGRAYSIGISFSPPYVIGASVDLVGAVIERELVTLSERIVAPEVLIAHAEAIVRGLVAKAPVGPAVLAGVAVGVPDLVDHRAGIVHRSPTVGLAEYPLARVLGEALADLGVPVTIDNDATFGALAESRQRAISSRANLLYLTGSTAMGGGIIADGQLFRGSAGYAGEVGHMVVNPAGSRCVCGNVGCWESEVGLRAFLARVGDEPEPGVDGDAHIGDIVRRAQAGDPRATEAIASVAHFLGLGLSSLINIFNPDTVILGGYFIRLYPLLIDAVTTTVQQRVLSDRLAECRILQSDLEMYPGAIGAATSVIDRVVQDPSAIPRFARAAESRLAAG